MLKSESDETSGQLRGVYVRRTEVREQLRELIDGRPPGEALPSERTLSERLGVSRPTVRAALDELAASGLVVRRHGLGTFTSPQPIHQVLPTGREPVPPADGDWESEVLEYDVSSAGARLGQRLRISPGDDVVRALRRRIVDGQPMALEEIRLPAAAVPRITRSDFESGSLYQRLRDLHGVTPADAVQTTEPTVTDAERVPPAQRAAVLPGPAVRTHHPRHHGPHDRVHPVRLPGRPLPDNQPPDLRPRLRLIARTFIHRE